MTTLELDVDLLSALGIWEVDELELPKERMSNTNEQLLYFMKACGKTVATSHSVDIVQGPTDSRV